MGDPRNQGHGHVVPRPDGAKARCGGPAMCRVCQAERAALETAPKQAQETSLPPQGAEPTSQDIQALIAELQRMEDPQQCYSPYRALEQKDIRAWCGSLWRALAASPAPAPQEPAAEPDHELKTWPPFFEDVLSGRKTFEVRKNDRGFAVGHVVRLNEWAPGKGYTGRFVDKRITYMLTGPQFGIEAGYSVLALYASPAHQEPARPDILEKLTYHQHERDDLTLDECLEVLASGYRKVHGRTDRQMVMQILALLAASPAPGALGAVDAECAASGRACSIKPCGPNGSLQCEWCGEAAEPEKDKA